MATERRTLLDVSEADLAYLDPHFTVNWPDVLREMAISHFLTLMSDPRTKSMGLETLAELAVQLTFGISHDLGGTQPYIPVGANLKHDQRKAKALALLGQGVAYVDVAKKCGITASRVRNIEREHTRKKRKERRESTSAEQGQALQ